MNMDKLSPTCTAEETPDGILFTHYMPPLTITFPPSLRLRALGWSMVGILAMVVGAGSVEAAFNLALPPIVRIALWGGVGISSLLLYGVVAPNRSKKKDGSTTYYYVTNDGMAYRWYHRSKPSSARLVRKRLYKKYGWWKGALADLPTAVRESLGKTEPEILLLG